KQLEEKEGVAAINSRDDALIKERSMEEGEAATERVSDDTEEMATMLTSMDAVTVLASGVVDVPTGSGSIPTASTPAEGSVPIGSKEVPTASPVFATAIVVTPFTRRKGKEVMVESETPKKQKVREQIDAQSMIDGLDSNNEIVAKYLEEYRQFSSELPMERRIEKQKSSEEITEEAKSPEEVTEEKVKEMMHMVPIEEVYVEALQVKHPTIDWKGRFEPVMGISKKTLNIKPAVNDKEKELWVKLKRLYEPDVEDLLWTYTQHLMHAPVEWKNLMHAPIEWKLYGTCGVHHVTSKDKEIFMLVEKDYPFTKGLAIGMISYKLQVENYSKMANDLILKIYKIASSPRQQGD
nr:hypothetical protein [Tanacetum cinerariifolium]